MLAERGMGCLSPPICRLAFAALLIARTAAILFLAWSVGVIPCLHGARHSASRRCASKTSLDFCPAHTHRIISSRTPPVTGFKMSDIWLLCWSFLRLRGGMLTLLGCKYQGMERSISDGQACMPWDRLLWQRTAVIRAAGGRSAEMVTV